MASEKVHTAAAHTHHTHASTQTTLLKQMYIDHSRLWTVGVGSVSPLPSPSSPSSRMEDFAANNSNTSRSSSKPISTHETATEKRRRGSMRTRLSSPPSRALLLLLLILLGLRLTAQSDSESDSESESDPTHCRNSIWMFAEGASPTFPVSSEEIALDSSQLRWVPLAPNRVEEYGARCNDGSTPGMFISLASTTDSDGDSSSRRSTTDVTTLAAYRRQLSASNATTAAAFSSKWLIYMEGGGACVDAFSCTKRRGDTANLTSSLFLADTISAANLLQAEEDTNPAAYDRHRVYLHYCSSDFWLGGRASNWSESVDQTVNEEEAAQQGVLSTFAFQGANIFRALIDQLITGDWEAAATSGDIAAGGIFPPLPSLCFATDVMVVGSSAGGVGAMAHLEWLRQQLAETTTQSHPPQVRLILDSAWFVNFQSQLSLVASIAIDQYNLTGNYLSTSSSPSSSLTSPTSLTLPCTHANYTVHDLRGDGHDSTSSSRSGVLCCFLASCMVQNGFLPQDVHILVVQSLFDSFLLALGRSELLGRLVPDLLPSVSDTPTAQQAFDLAIEMVDIVASYGGVYNATLQLQVNPMMMVQQIQGPPSFTLDPSTALVFPRIHTLLLSCFNHMYMPHSMVDTEVGHGAFISNRIAATSWETVRASVSNNTLRMIPDTSDNNDENNSSSTRTIRDIVTYWFQMTDDSAASEFTSSSSSSTSSPSGPLRIVDSCSAVQCNPTCPDKATLPSTLPVIELDTWDGFKNSETSRMALVIVVCVYLFMPSVLQLIIWASSISQRVKTPPPSTAGSYSKSSSKRSSHLDRDSSSRISSTTTKPAWSRTNSPNIQTGVTRSSTLTASSASVPGRSDSALIASPVKLKPQPEELEKNSPSTAPSSLVQLTFSDMWYWPVEIASRSSMRQVQPFFQATGSTPSTSLDQHIPIVVDEELLATASTLCMTTARLSGLSMTQSRRSLITPRSMKNISQPRPSIFRATVPKVNQPVTVNHITLSQPQSNAPSSSPTSSSANDPTSRPMEGCVIGGVTSNNIHTISIPTDDSTSDIQVVRFHHLAEVDAVDVELTPISSTHSISSGASTTDLSTLSSSPVTPQLDSIDGDRPLVVNEVSLEDDLPAMVSRELEHLNEHYAQLERDLHAKYTRMDAHKGVPQSQPILAGITGTCQSGELTAVMGASGSGKSTLIELLACRRSFGMTSGTISINAFSVLDRLDWFRAHTGYVPQYGSCTIPELSALSNLVYAARLRLPTRWTEEARRARVDEVVELCGLTDFQHTPVGSNEGGNGTQAQLSGGQRRRVALAIELLSAPRILLLDEITSGLDAASALDIVWMLHRIAKKCNVCVVLSIHQPRVEAWRLFDQVIVMSDGEILYHAPPIHASHEFICGIQEAVQLGLAGSDAHRLLATFSSWIDATSQLSTSAFNVADFILDCLKYVHLRYAMQIRYKRLHQQQLHMDKTSRNSSRRPSFMSVPGQPTTIHLDPLQAEGGDRSTKTSSWWFGQTVSHVITLEARRVQVLEQHPFELIRMPLVYSVLGLFFGGVFFRRIDSALDTCTFFVLLTNICNHMSATPVSASFYNSMEIFNKERMSACVTPVQQILSFSLHMSTLAVLSSCLGWVSGFLLSAPTSAIDGYDLLMQTILECLCLRCYTIVISMVVFIGYPHISLVTTTLFTAFLVAGSFMFSGFMIAPRLIPPVLSWMMYTNPMYWCFGAIVKIRLNALLRTIRQLPTTVCPPGEGAFACLFKLPDFTSTSSTTSLVLESYDIDHVDIYVNLAILLVMSFLMLLVSWLLLVAPWRRLLPSESHLSHEALQAIASYRTEHHKRALEDVQLQHAKQSAEINAVVRTLMRISNHSSRLAAGGGTGSGGGVLSGDLHQVWSPTPPSSGSLPIQRDWRSYTGSCRWRQFILQRLSGGISTALLALWSLDHTELNTDRIQQILHDVHERRKYRGQTVLVTWQPHHQTQKTKKINESR